MLNKNYRWIQYYDLILRSSPPASPAIKLNKLVLPLEEYFLAGNAKQLIRDETALCRIADFRHDVERDMVVLLVQLADKNVSNPAYSDFPTGKVRIGERKEEEGIAVSAHIMISATENKPDSESYLCLIEQVPGLNRTQIERFLTSQFKEISAIINLTYENTKKESVGQRPLVDLYPYPSTSIREAMRTGVLREFSFVKRVPVNREIDELAYVSEEIQRITFKIGPDLTFQGRLDALKNLVSVARRRDAEDIRIKYKDEDENREHTVTITDVPEDDTDKVSLVKSDRVLLKEPINDCEIKLHEGIIERMFELFSEMKQ